MIHPDIESILISTEEIDSIVTRLAAEIDRDYAGDDKNLVLVCILKGSVVFMGDLMKKITVPVQIDFMKASSYGSGTTSSGNINILLDLKRKDIADCDILIVEDIIDSGNTLNFLIDHLMRKGARSVKTVTLLDKPSRRAPHLKDFNPDYHGAIIDDVFAVGFGLDYNEKYRALPYIGILKPEVYHTEQ
ncbi:MAG: hypoxanthine phosphoribosyltransferase [Clostridia bacterium]|nr:hypoxanthine phosphoribosyltransferase [Clostridia bacterium]